MTNTVSGQTRAPGPTAEVRTRWGTLYAFQSSPDSYRFSTRSPNPGDSQNRLLINKVVYTCDIEVSGEVLADDQMLGREYIDESRHVSNEAMRHALRRHDGEEVTGKAQSVFRRKILPELADWSRSPEALGLAMDTFYSQRNGWLTDARHVEQVLQAATERVQRAQFELEKDWLPAQADVEFIQFVKQEVVRAPEWRTAARGPVEAEPHTPHEVIRRPWPLMDPDLAQFHTTPGTGPEPEPQTQVRPSTPPQPLSAPEPPSEASPSPATASQPAVPSAVEQGPLPEPEPPRPEGLGL